MTYAELSATAKNRERSTVSTSLVIVNTLNQFFDKIHVSGDDRARTDNLRLARAALSQLSYVPVNSADPATFRLREVSGNGPLDGIPVDVGGLEPPTSALSELRSNQLIYTSGWCLRAAETGEALCHSK